MANYSTRHDDWEAKHNSHIVLWHGCTCIDKNSIKAVGIDIKKCRKGTDFGQGFYTTTNRKQAESWAILQYFNWQAVVSPTALINFPVVLEFRIRRSSSTNNRQQLESGLDALRILPFVRGDKNADEYWCFVEHCRTTGRGKSEHHHNRPETNWFDMVVGPVARDYRKRILNNSSFDQYSFHGRGIQFLNDVMRRSQGNIHEKNTVFANNYRWHMVSW